MEIPSNNYKPIIQRVSITVITGGVIVIFGWLFNIPILTSIIPDYATMKLNTALGFVLLGGSIFLQTKNLRKRWSYLAKTLAILTLLLGILTIYEELFGYNLGIDELIIEDTNSRTLEKPFPGRMSLITALCFSLLGTFALVLDVKKKWVIINNQILIHLVTLFSFIAIVGYLFNVPISSKTYFLSSMAIHTSLGLFVLSISSSLFYPFLGLTKLFIGNQIGNLMARKIFVQMTVLTLLIGYIRILTYRNSLVSEEFGISLFAITFIVISLFLVWRVSVQLNAIQLFREKAENDLMKINSILDATPDPIVIINEQGNIQLCNTQVEQVLGYDKDELVNKHLNRLIPDRFLSSHNGHVRSFFSNPDSINISPDLDLFAKKKNGGEIPVEVSLSSLIINNELLVFAAIRDISERKKEESKISQLAAIVNSSLDAIISKDLAGNILTWNKGAENILGFKAEEIIGKHISVLFPEDLKEEEKSLTLKIAEGEYVDQYESVRVRKDHRRIIVSVTLSPIKDKNGKVVAISKWLQDVTQSHKDAENYRIVSERLKIATTASHIGIWDFDVINNSLIWDESMYEIYGASPENFSGAYEAWASRLHPDDMHIAEEELAAALSGEKDFDTAFRIIWPDESVHYIRSKAYTDRDENGQALRILGTNWDITAQKKAELELMQSHQQNQIFIDQAPSAIAMFDSNMHYMAASQKWREDYGLADRKLIGYSCYEDFPDIGDNWKKIHQECLAGAIRQSDEELIKRADGSFRWLSWDIRPWYKSDDEIGGIIIYTADITNRKRTELALNYANEELRAILNTGLISIIGTDQEGLITLFNRGAEEMLQYKASEIIDVHTPGLFHLKQEVEKRGEELSQKFGKLIQGFDVFTEFARQGKSESREWTYVRKDGSSFPVQLMVSALRNKEGNIIGFLGVATDLTERKETEKKLRKVSVLESKNKDMEQLTYVMSHDLREPLLTIINYIEIFREDYHSVLGEEGIQIINRIKNASKRMDTLIKNMLDYARLGQVGEKEKVDINTLIQEVNVSLASRISSSKATIYLKNLPSLMAYSTELGFLFQNLIYNAIKFCKKGMPPIVTIKAEKIKDGWLFEVVDNGIGIEKENLEIIFRMFSRLNRRNEFEGTGIGLAQCKRIVEMHNGTIWAKSKPGVGTSFYFTILNQ